MPLEEGLRASLEKGIGVSALRSKYPVPECCLDIMWEGLQRVKTLIIDNAEDPSHREILLQLANSYSKTLLGVVFSEVPPTFQSLKNIRNNLLETVNAKRNKKTRWEWKEGILSRPLEAEIRAVIKECGQKCLQVMKEDPEKTSILKAFLSSRDVELLERIGPLISVPNPNS